MVTTRAQETTTGHGAPNHRDDDQPARPAAPVTPPPPRLPATEADAQILAVLVQQVEALAMAVRGLQQPPPEPMADPAIASTARASGQSPPPSSPRRRSPSLPPRGASSGWPSPSPVRGSPPSCHRPRRSPRREKRRRSPSHSSREGSSLGDTRLKAEQRLAEHDRELRDIHRRLASLKTGSRSEEDYDSRPPLSRQIMEQPVPGRFKMPQIEPYDGTTDPADHLESYKALMRIQGATDALLCIAFPATLRKAARAWYSRLEPRSINSFPQLERKFAAHFSACRKVPREADSLFSVRQ